MQVSIRNRGALRRLARKLRNPEPMLQAIAESGQEECLNLISEGFRKGADPYGKAWGAPNKLQITGRLRSYARGRRSAGGWQVHATDQKAIWHHAPGKRKAGKSWTVAAHSRTSARHYRLKSGKLSKRKRKSTGAVGAHTAQWRKTWKLPTRMQVPTTARGLPTNWARRLRATALEGMRDWLNG